VNKRTVTTEELRRPTVPYEEGLQTVLGRFSSLPPVRVPLREARGLVLAEDVVAEHDVPGFANSAMDGYAIRSADTHEDKPVVLRLVDDLPAGVEPLTTIEPGTAATIMTGAPLPPGADAVVPWEDTEKRDGAVAVLIDVSEGKHVRPRGEDVRAGDRIFGTGIMLNPVHLGVLAALGRTHVLVHPRPRVALLSTGDELAEPGAPLRPGQVYDANRILLATICEQTGAHVVDEALIADDPGAIGRWLRSAAARADLIVTTGGASVGEHDWIRELLERNGTLHMWRVAIKPGKPVVFGSVEGTSVLGLPGNPGSAFVATHVFVAPAIRIMAGRAPEPRQVRARLGAAVKGSPSRTLFCRVRLDGDAAIPLPAQSSVVLSNLIPTEGFAIIPPGGLPDGAKVSVELL
jgi:molybdopterin molybdotransferase